MKKKLNPAWLYLIVTIALIPCCVRNSHLGTYLNIYGVGLGRTSHIYAASVFAILHLCLMVYLIVSLFRKQYNLNVFLPVSLIALLRISAGFQWVGISGVFHIQSADIIKLHFLLTVIYNVVMVIFTAVNVFPNSKENKVKRNLWILPSVLLTFKYLVGISTYSFYITYQGDIKRAFAYTFSTLLRITIDQKIVLAVAVIDIIATALFSYNLVTETTPKKKKTQTIHTRINTSVEYNAYCGMAKHILLCIFTLGIWQCIWIWRTTKFLNQAPKAERYNPTKKLLLCMFVPFYLIYWFYKHGQRIDVMYKNKKLGNSDMATLCLILGIFVPIVAYIIMQDKINTLCTVNANNAGEDSTENKAINFEDLNKLKDLLDNGIITQDEFDEKKKQLLMYLYYLSVLTLKTG